MNLDINIIKRQCDELIKFIEENGGGEMMNDFTNIVELTYSKNDKKGITKILKDLSEWASGLSPNNKESINAILMAVEKENNVSALRILEIGKITNDEEYELLLEFVDKKFIETDEKKNIDKANKLLSEYCLSKEEE